MATTTNYGWDTPDDTDLVKDGAAAIRTLGSSVDTTTKALNPETTLGDIAYRSATSNTNTRLAIGSAGQVLTVAAGVPSWASPSDQTPLTTKGDLFTFSTVDARLGVGANDTVLIADSAQATGLKWGTAPSGGVDLLSTTTLSSSSTTINIVTTYKTLVIVGDSIYGSAENTSGGISCRFNGDSGSNYNNTLFRFTSTAGGGTDGTISNFNVTERLSSTDSLARWSTFLLTIPNYTATSTVPFFIQSRGATNSAVATLIATGQYDGTAAISSITFNAPSGETINGTIKIYGAK
jgi:hypothetical protein